MAKIAIPIYFKIITFLLLHFNSMYASQSSSFYLTKFDKDSNFESLIALYGDAKVVVNESSLQLTRSVSSSSGRIMFKNPIKVVGGNPVSLVSFSTNFSFSMSPGSGNELAFVMVPSSSNVSAFDSKSEFGVSKAVAVAFGAVQDARSGDSHDKHVGFDVGVFVLGKVKKVSSKNVVFSSGKRLNSWIDYEAGSKRLEVRLSESGDRKPVDPVLSFPVDLSRDWYDEEFMVGFSSSNRNSSRTCLLYSWSFTTRTAPHWMHSQPFDPATFVKNEKVKPVVAIRKKSDCILKVAAAMIFGIGCGAVGASVVLYLRIMFGNRRPVAPEVVHPADFEYAKFKVVEDKVVAEDVKK